MKKNLFLFLFFTLILTSAFCDKPKILLGCPVCQKPNILKEFLQSLKELNKEDFVMDFLFIDDNKNQESKNLLKAFASEINSSCFIMPSCFCSQDYICDENRHYWSDDIIWKVAKFKNLMIEKASLDNYDYLFLIDSDIVLHPLTINQLLKADKDIISNIFWTPWGNKNTVPLPQVWMFDEYELYDSKTKSISQEERIKKTEEFLNKLKKPGVYEVGGLGACTLISKNALKKGISFDRIHNVSFWGEDRHFCVRAVALGLSLFVDTHYPAYHIYREWELNGVQAYKNNNNKINSKPKITLSMIVRNEAGRYLREVLEDAKGYISRAVIIDDASTDNTVEICKEVLKDTALCLIENEVSVFSNEVVLRKQQFEETIKTNPEWILILDADEIFEKKFKEKIFDVLSNTKADAVYFRLYDFWDENHYRDDKYWSAHKNFRPFLIRYKPQIDYKWNESPLHCGRLPLNVCEFSYELSDLRLKHYGWKRKEDRVNKYERYIKSDPLGIYGWKQQYDSILEQNPKLAEWIE